MIIDFNQSKIVLFDRWLKSAFPRSNLMPTLHISRIK